LSDAILIYRTGKNPNVNVGTHVDLTLTVKVANGTKFMNA